MPIFVSHQPSMELLARAGYTAGAGQFLQQQREMAQRERMQERSIQAQLLQQQIDHYQGLERFALSAQANQAAQQQAQAARMELEKLDNQNRMQWLRQQSDNAKALEKTRAENAFLQDTSQFFWNSAQNRLDEIDTLIGEGASYDPIQEAAAQKLRQQMKELQENKKATPVQKAQGMWELAQQMPVPQQTQPSMKDIVEEQSYKTKDEYGRDVIWTRDRSGALKHEVVEPPKTDELKAQREAQMTDWERFYANQELYWNVVDKLFDAMTKKGVRGEEPPPFSQVINAVRQHYGQPPLTENQAKAAAAARKQTMAPEQPNTQQGAELEFFYDGSIDDFVPVDSSGNAVPQRFHPG